VVPDAIPSASAARRAAKSSPSSHRHPIIWIGQQRKEGEAFLCSGLIESLFIEEASGCPQAQIRDRNVVERLSKEVSNAPPICQNEDFSGRDPGMLREIPV
jgi:hypothetical protein